jgi:hypothetical protein
VLVRGLEGLHQAHKVYATRDSASSEGVAGREEK